MSGVGMQSIMPGESVEKCPKNRFARFGKQLGQGQFKRVFLALDTETGQEVAWNTVSTVNLSESDRQGIFTETELLKQLNHPHIMEFYDVWTDLPNRQICFVTEKASGTLKQYIMRVHPVKAKLVSKWCVQILSALEYLHSLTPRIIHRDVKCDNIFIDGAHGDVRIGDFGFAANLDSESKEACKLIGTPCFMSPEVWNQDYDELADIFAFGMCVLEICCNCDPFRECNSLQEIIGSIAQGRPPDDAGRIKDEQFRDVCMQCISDVKNRPSAAKLLKHRAFAESVEEFLPESQRIRLMGLSVTSPSPASVNAKRPSSVQVANSMKSGFGVKPQNAFVAPSPSVARSDLSSMAADPPESFRNHGPQHEGTFELNRGASSEHLLALGVNPMELKYLDSIKIHQSTTSQEITHFFRAVFQMERGKWASLIEHYLILPWVETSSGSTIPAAFLSQKDWPTLLLPLFSNSKTAESSESEERRLFGFAMNMFALILNHHMATSEKDNTYGEITKVIDTLGSSVGWHQDTIMLCRLILFSLCTMMGVSMASFRENVNHPGWRNLFHIIGAVETFIFYRPLYPRTADGKENKVEVHLVDGLCADMILVDAVLGFLERKLKVIQYVQLPVPEGPEGKLLKKWQEKASSTFSFFHVVKDAFANIEAGKVEQPCYNECAAVGSKRKYHLSKSKIRDCLEEAAVAVQAQTALTGRTARKDNGAPTVLVPSSQPALPLDATFAPSAGSPPSSFPPPHQQQQTAGPAETRRKSLIQNYMQSVNNFATLTPAEDSKPGTANNSNPFSMLKKFLLSPEVETDKDKLGGKTGREGKRGGMASSAPKPKQQQLGAPRENTSLAALHNSPSAKSTFVSPVTVNNNNAPRNPSPFSTSPTANQQNLLKPKTFGASAPAPAPPIPKSSPPAPPSIPEEETSKDSGGGFGARIGAKLKSTFASSSQPPPPTTTPPSSVGGGKFVSAFARSSNDSADASPSPRGPSQSVASPKTAAAEAPKFVSAFSKRHSDGPLPTAPDSGGGTPTAFNSNFAFGGKTPVNTTKQAAAITAGGASPAAKRGGGATQFVAPRAGAGVGRGGAAAVSPGSGGRGGGAFAKFGGLQTGTFAPKHATLPSPIQTAPKQLFCKECGNKLDDVAIFCTGCGSKV